jgi:hypothetical protein
VAISFVTFDPMGARFFAKVAGTRGGTISRRTDARPSRVTTKIDDGLARKICKDLGVPPVK